MSRSSNGEFMNFRPKKNVLQPFSNLREKKRSRSELVAARSYPVNGSDVKPNMKIGHFGLKNWAK